MAGQRQSAIILVGAEEALFTGPRLVIKAEL